MRHRIAGKQLSRNTSHRRALRRNLAVALFERGTIRTTEVKAKELRRFVEKLITIARKGTLNARRRIISELQDRELVDADGVPTGQTIVGKLIGEIAPRYKDRPGGYTRIIRISDRRIGDAGKQVLLQLVEETAKQEGEDKAGKSRKQKRAAKGKPAEKETKE